MILTLEGEKFVGVFRQLPSEVSQKEGGRPFIARQTYQMITEGCYWWVGFGTIRRRSQRKESILGIITDPRRAKDFHSCDPAQDYSLEDELVNYGQRRETFPPFYLLGYRLVGDRPQLVEGAYPKVVDLSLSMMLKAAKLQSALSLVRPPLLRLEDLAKKGLIQTIKVTEPPGHQLELN